MSSISITVSMNFYVQSCINCGCRFAVPTEFEMERRKDRQTFYCPNGHRMSYTKSEADELRAKLEENQRLLNQSINREHTIAVEFKRTAAAKKRLENRISKGVCPVAGCHRHFTNLNRHMQTQHGRVIEASANGQLAIEGAKVQ